LGETGTEGVREVPSKSGPPQPKKKVRKSSAKSTKRRKIGKSIAVASGSGSNLSPKPRAVAARPPNPRKIASRVSEYYDDITEALFESLSASKPRVNGRTPDLRGKPYNKFVALTLSWKGKSPGDRKSTKTPFIEERTSTRLSRQTVLLSFWS
jgi:hypothetical protein